MTAFIVASSIVAAAIIGLATCLFQEYKEWNDSEDPIIKFKGFVDLYAIKPENWILHDEYVVYDNGRINQSIRFSIIDWLKYLMWRNSLDKIKEDRKRDKITELLIEQWQKDVEDFKQMNPVTGKRKE